MAASRHPALRINLAQVANVVGMGMGQEYAAQRSQGQRKRSDFSCRARTNINQEKLPAGEPPHWNRKPDRCFETSSGRPAHGVPDIAGSIS
jgi:hypothetical protein